MQQSTYFDATKFLQTFESIDKILRINRSGTRVSNLKFDSQLSSVLCLRFTVKN